MMQGQLSHELEVAGVPASEVWEVYGTMKLGMLVDQLLPSIVKVNIVEGNGGVGTVLNLTFPPETPGFTSYKEKFTKIDDEKRVKEAEVIEGGYLDLGFSLYRVRFEILEKDAASSIIKTTIEYEINEESAANASLVTIKPLEVIAEVIGKYLIEKKSNANDS